VAPLAPQPVWRAIDLTAPHVQREITEEEHAQPMQDGRQPEDQRPDYRKMAEEVWPHIRKKIRVERERERGLPS
jgi:hypothetical protein